MKKTYRTASGKILDMDRLRLLNEKAKAVGNMNANARGDEIDNSGNVIRPKNEIIRERYNSKR
jgi:hypothetical protein